MTRHTPGPWLFALFDDEPNKAFVQFTAGYAEVHGSRNRREANAQLMAAAPDLLLALQWALGYLPSVKALEQIGLDSTGYADGIAAVRAAIKKATEQS